MRPGSDMDKHRVAVAEWLERYNDNDTGVAPVLIMLVCTAVCALVFWLRVAPTATKNEKDVFFLVAGTPVLGTVLTLVMETYFPPTDKPEDYTLVTYIMGVTEGVDWVLNEPATNLFGRQAAFGLQMVLFTFGVYWFNVTKLFNANDLPDTRDSKLSKIDITLLVGASFFVMRMVMWAWKIVYVFVKCTGIYKICLQIKQSRDWLSSTERTSSKKKDALTLSNSTDPVALWNKIATKPGMEDKKYDVITQGCRNKTARQNALLPYLGEYFDVDDQRTEK
jgi:hypothetical protein